MDSRDRRPPTAGNECEPAATMLRVEWVVDSDVTPPLDQQQASAAVVAAALHRGYDRGEIGIRIASDAAIRRVNREYLGHDYPTDVISFSYRDEKPLVEGELVVSAETAARCAGALGWSAANELLLYIVHGTLHITGMDDADENERHAMRAAERSVLTGLGVHDVSDYGADRPAAGGRK